VSAKLIIMAYRNNINNQVLARELSEIKATLRGKEKKDE
jgi:hypothetical protein